MRDENNRVFLKCGCTCAVLELHNEDSEGHESLLNISLWKRRGSGKMGWRQRLRLVWDVLKTGDPFTDDIILHEDEAQKLKDFVNKKVCTRLLKTETKIKNSVVVLPVRDDKILLSKRLETDTYSGYWQVPGGKVNDGEEDFLVAAQRELWEEAGILVQESRFEFIELEKGEPTVENEFIYAVYLRPGEVPKNPEPDKHTDWAWYSFDKALELNLIPVLKKHIGNLNK